MEGFIKKLNKHLDMESKRTGDSPIDILMNMALEAGIEDFNPYRANDYQLMEIVTVHLQRDEKEAI